MIRRVVKVGGSLLKRKNLVNQIADWTNEQSPAQNLFLFGGGEVIDSVRNLDRIHSLDPTMTHWLCVDLLDTSFTIASSWFHDWPAIRSKQQFRELMLQRPEQSNIILKCTSFYHRDQPGKLPIDWRTTTDSIAAQLAAISNASELVLLKSCPVDCRLSQQALADQGIVDDAFPDAAKAIASVRVEPLA